MPDTDDEVVIRAIKAGDKLTGLSLGDAAFTPLKTFLQKEAKKYQDASLARTYAAFLRSKVVGYITLVCGQVDISENGEPSLPDGNDVQYRYDHYPAVKIARLAVAKDHQGSGLGSALVDLALGVTEANVCPTVGCRFIVVDSKRQSVGFYKKAGFVMIDTPENEERDHPVMFIDMMKAVKAASD
ncbi:GNAT family N-acetyltransferase [Parvularcula dongshanensis]|uniref:Ribosomal protein S18 acetylase RimI-like enzyme n=1 Tax=Parvularcula dongshanensis TaxID=1173995 RepID=A0A840I825_9PROT|nr:GNAT family N-acetyltransferase [Parvularcula dongshanensis]MBB4660258.1 ribosomal protein S18 acetylase RimI-like enzyme [Parvularcula dongshanensis]